MNAKPQRIVDEELLAQVRRLPCMACSGADPYAALEAVQSGASETHPHHLQSRGAGGDDVAANCIPVCFTHHREFHDKGISHMNQKYPSIAAWLSIAGWKKDALIGWYREER